MRIVFLAFAILGLVACKKNETTQPDPPIPAVVDVPRLQPLYDHAVVLILENKPSEKIIGSADASLINSLVAKSANFLQSYAIEHPSQPTYLDLFSGDNQGVTDNSRPTNHFTTPNLASQLITAGKTFATYLEDLPLAGWDSSIKKSYVRKHNPVANWMGTGTNQVPGTTNQPFTAFPSDFTKLPTISFVVPSLQTICMTVPYAKGMIG